MEFKRDQAENKPKVTLILIRQINSPIFANRVHFIEITNMGFNHDVWEIRIRNMHKDLPRNVCRFQLSYAK